jgi:hypothetical protein
MTEAGAEEKGKKYGFIGIGETLLIHSKTLFHIIDFFKFLINWFYDFFAIRIVK